jgi:imidazolonepropionase-like amidohydrolase
VKKTRILLLVLCELFFFCSLMTVGAAVPASPVSIVLTGGNIWDGKANRPLGEKEILVQEGKIIEIGKTVSHPDGAKIIDLSGHTVTPGFIECHAHVELDPNNLIATGMKNSGTRHALAAIKNLRTLLTNGFTSVRDVGSFAQEYNTIDLRNAIEAGEIIGPRMFVAPHFITATGAHGDVSGFLAPEYGPALKSKVLADGPDELRRTVREEIRAGGDWIKFGASGGFVSPSDDPRHPTYSQEEMNVIVQTAHDLGIPVSSHVYGGEALRRAIEAGVDSIEHGSLASQQLLSEAERKGIYFVPTQYTFEQSLNNAKYWETHSKEEYEKTARHTQSLLEGMKYLANSDVKIAFGTDVGLFPFPDNWKEFPTMVKNGVSIPRTMRSATSVAAEMLGRPDLGQIAVGKTADIIAMPGNPFDDINLTGQVDFVMKAGIIYKQNGVPKE